MKPDYHIQDGCHNCSHAFLKEEYDQQDEYYCEEGSSVRPICGSVLMGEVFDAFSFNKDWAVWNLWKKDKKVESWGKCSAWNKYEATETTTPEIQNQ